MPNDYMAVGSAIHSRLGTAMGSAVYRDLAPQGGTPPYIVWGRVSGNDQHTFDRDGIELEYYAKGVSNRLWSTEAYQAYGTAHALLEGAPLSVTGYTVLRCERRNTFDYQDSDGFWHVGGNYRIVIWQT